MTDGYGYDAIDQVTSVAYSSGRNVGYAYDAAGNRTSMSDSGNTTTYTANNLNQYSAISGPACQEQEGRRLQELLHGKQ